MKMVGEGMKPQDDSDPRPSRTNQSGNAWRYSPPADHEHDFGLYVLFSSIACTGSIRNRRSLVLSIPVGLPGKQERTGAVIKQIGTSLNPNFEDPGYQVTYIECW